MAAYQRMIDETDPTQREETLTETGQNSVPEPRQLDRIQPRLSRTVAYHSSGYGTVYPMPIWRNAEDRASNAQEEARQKRKEALEEVIPANLS
ncbi:hypothetical protein Tco_0487216 [Tanacetum coccineum]